MESQDEEVHYGYLKRPANIKNMEEARQSLIQIRTDADAKEWMAKYPDAWEVSQRDPLAIQGIKQYLPALAKYL